MPDTRMIFAEECANSSRIEVHIAGAISEDALTALRDFVERQQLRAWRARPRAALPLDPTTEISAPPEELEPI